MSSAVSLSFSYSGLESEVVTRGNIRPSLVRPEEIGGITPSREISTPLPSVG